MNATITQPTGLKALSKRVLQRNHERNYNATTPGNQRNFQPGETPSKVAPVADWQPEPKAWLTETGELRTQGVLNDLADEIVKLTGENLELQKVLLLRHCERYDRHHFQALAEQWQERAAIMEYAGGLSREQAELEAAELLRCTAFLSGLRAATKGEP